ncbi:MAG: hypothetical protein AAB927_01550 [Patescibacteria group bacterium]
MKHIIGRHVSASTFCATLAYSAALFLANVSIALAAVADGSGSGSTLQNPLQFNDIAGFIAGALKVLVMVALPIISLFIVYSGFLFVSAQGNTEKLATARSNFFWVVIGAILILGAWVIATLIGGTVTQLTK